MAYDHVLLVLTTADGLTSQCGYISRGDIKPTIYRPLLRPIRMEYWSKDVEEMSAFTIRSRCYEFDRVYAGAAFYKERLDA